MEKYEIEIENVYKNFCKTLSYSLIAILLIYNILYLSLISSSTKIVIKAIQEILMYFLISFVVVATLLSVAKINYYKLLKFINVLFAIMVFCFSLLLNNNTGTIYLYYLPLTLMFLFLSKFKGLIISTFLFLCLIISAPYISKYFNLPVLQKTANSKGSLDHLDYMRIFMSCYLSILVVYYYHVINEIKSKNLFSTFERNKTIISKKTDKFDLLYASILKHLEESKTYRDPNFSIKMLSEILETNENYISKAINKKSNHNFNSLINSYRINQVKEDLNQNKHTLFTLEHIYRNSGFTQQSTFNRVFKDQTNITPSQYIESLAALQSNLNQATQ